MSGPAAHSGRDMKFPLGAMTFLHVSTVASGARESHGVMRMQALLVFQPHLEASQVRVAVEYPLYPSRRILAEHEVAAVGQRESLLVLALDGGLHGRTERPFDRIEQI